MESTNLSIAKTVYWRIVATLITGVVTFLLTGRIDFAVAVGLADTGLKRFIYFSHERLWTRIGYGKIRSLDYVI
jgi:uncharacterized membrane protein